MRVSGMMPAAIGAGIIAASLAAQPAPQPSSLAPAETDEQRIAYLVTATHILAQRGILDGRGHVSVRSASNPKHFFMMKSRPPAEVTRADVVELDENSQPIDPKAQPIFLERVIHGEILRARPDVQAVVHAHPIDVIPFSTTKVPLKALLHTAYFLGTTAAPVFDIREAEGADNRMLVRTNATGAALARTLGQRSVVLLRGHGMAVTAPSVHDAVYRTIYTIANAQAEKEALALGQPVFLNAKEASLVEFVDPLWAIWRTQAEGR